MVNTYYSPTGNPEVWDEKPEGYFTIEEWQTAHPDPSTKPPTLEEARAAKIKQIDAETSAAILAGFDFTLQEQSLHFSYELTDQQNFADTANAATLSLMGVPGVPDSVTWNGWAMGTDGGRILQRVTLTPADFLSLYMGGALAHKAAQMETGGRRKAEAEAAASLEELEAV